MRQNLPVTQREYPFPDGTTLMSMTDTDSRVVYANTAFVAVSGFEREQLIGQPHNLVRHPDMPREAFADMWSTLKAGQAWSGAGEEPARTNGDHYWVRANATPVMRRGRVAGYLSVRTKPAARRGEGRRAAVRGASAKAALKGLRFERGVVVRGGIGSAAVRWARRCRWRWSASRRRPARSAPSCRWWATVVTAGGPVAMAVETGLTVCRRAAGELAAAAPDRAADRARRLPGAERRQRPAGRET
ncbi:MAG: PAS domain-containing protein [Comamonadaceae bacterium]|nr:PAS domain-containing protein [Comamonadaceae bacterium]